jgi:RNA polymerase sigma factor (sigma-70 family)
MNDSARYGPGFDARKERSAEPPADFPAIAELLAALERDYLILLHRLSHRLHSQEAAEDALHDVYVKLRSYPDIGEIRSHRAYLYRMGLNLAKNHIRAHSRTAMVDDFILALVPDIAPDPEQVAFARLEMDRALEALHAMPERRRQLFLARWRDGKPQAEIALEFGLHKRSVQKELARAETFLRKVLRRPKL